MSDKKRVLVAMSGGIDSSITAMLLHEQGYEIIGITMKTWDYASSGGGKKETGCCSLDSINDARNVAVGLDFPHYIIDIRKEFENYVIKNFVDEYMAGHTPNPCVLCNTHIKWDALLRRADQLNCQYIATGHYARNTFENGRHILAKGVDVYKDQSYFLWGLSQENLARTMFPLGNFNKTEIFRMAAKRGFNDLVDKPESYEICFVPDNDYRGFLSRKVAESGQSIDEGNFILKDGTVVGRHKGYPFYTIGQRKGLEIALGYPAYVTKINVQENTVVLGEKDELEKSVAWVRDYNLIKYASIPSDMEVTTKIRYKNKGTLSTIREIDGKIRIEFHQRVSAITPGQSAVFYDGDEVVGGGFIDYSE